jgi:hypothetical protein
MAHQTVLRGRVKFMHISFILSVTNKFFMLSVVMLKVIMLVPITIIDIGITLIKKKYYKTDSNKYTVSDTLFYQ